jgi:filamentous hemagglutinin family protein
MCLENGGMSTVFRTVITGFCGAFLGAAVGGVSRAEVATDGSLGPARELSGPDYAISHDLGKQVGGNLFHSFREFSLASGESATFTGPDTVDNIITRVTGGQPSSIQGTIRSEIPGADLYFLNPAGVLFGPGARLDVDGSFHVSTADYLRLGQAGRFDATEPSSSVLTVAPPSAFGFVSETPAKIEIRESVLEVPAGHTLSVVGGDIEVVGNPIPETPGLVAPSGRIQVVSVASAGEVVANGPNGAVDLEVGSFDRLGSIELSSNASLDVAGDPGGTVFIRSGRFVIEDGVIEAATRGDADHAGLAIDIAAAEDMKVIHSGSIRAHSVGAGNAGDVRIVAGSLEMTGEPGPSSPNDPCPGLCSRIASRVFGSGDGGDVEIETGNLRLNENSMIETQVERLGSGSGGNITVRSDNLDLSGGRGRSYISASTFGTGNAGDLSINAAQITLRSSGHGFSGLTAQVNSSASASPSAGELRIVAGTLQVLDGAEIDASLFTGSGKGGNIELTAGTVLIAGTNADGNRSGIYSRVLESSTGNGGNIRITSDDLQLAEGGRVTTSSIARGDAGNIEIRGGRLSVASGAQITSKNDGSGLAGNIDIDADRVVLAGPSPQGEQTGVFASSGPFAHDAGDIRLTAGTLEVLDGAEIGAETTGPGNGGSVDVVADSVVVSGIDSANGRRASISASASLIPRFPEEATGRGGDVRVEAAEVALHDHGSIIAQSASAGDGGNVVVNAQRVTLGNGASISVASSKQGNAGEIDLVATELFQSERSSVTAEASQAEGGNIRITSPNIQLLDQSAVTATVAGGEGGGGDVTLHATTLVALDNSDITANADRGPGGNISIEAQAFFRSPDSDVTASSRLGISGTVEVHAPDANLSGSLIKLPESFLEAAALLPQPCAARTGDPLSSFVIRGRDGIPIAPDELLPAPPADEAP